MFSSVIAGLKSLRSELEAFFLLPADMPMVTSHTVRLLAREYKKTGASVIYPVFQGLRGHPPLISARLLPAILASDGEQGGLRSILARYEQAAYELNVLDEGVLLDIDTPADYHDMTERCRHTPSSKVCEAIIKDLNVPANIIRHGAMVATVAGRMAARLNEAGLKLDTNLIMASGLLHDLAKGRPDHAKVGARIIKGMGYPEVATIVGSHTDIVFAEGQPLDEAAVLYLADKLVDRDRIVSIDERFRSALTKFMADAGAQVAIRARFAAAQTIARQVERTLGLSLWEVISGNTPVLANLQAGR